MKKLSILVALVLCLAILSGCTGAVLDVDSHEWVLISATYSNMGIEKTLEIENVVMTAKNGNVTITDAFDTAYSGTYILSSASSKGRDYSFSLGEFAGHGIVSLTDYYGEKSVPTVSLSLNNGKERYTLVFVSNE